MTKVGKRSQTLLDKWEALFKRNPELKERYQDYVKEYESLMTQYEELLND